MITSTEECFAAVRREMALADLAAEFWRIVEIAQDVAPTNPKRAERIMGKARKVRSQMEAIVNA